MGLPGPEKYLLGQSPRILDVVKLRDVSAIIHLPYDLCLCHVN